MIRILAAFLALIPIVAYGLDSDEFLLYGVNKKGRSFDITPGGNYYKFTEGDVSDPDGIRGDFFIWDGKNEKGKRQPAGSCVVRHSEQYTFFCKKGTQLFSGVVYEGQPLDKAKLKQYPEAKKLYQSFISKFEYGGLGAFYRCKTGCSPSLPPYLIFIWRGD